MLETARFEARRHARRAIAVGVAMSGMVGLVVGIFPSVQETEGLESYVQELPDAVSAAVGGDVSIATVEGFLIIEVYRMTWMLILGAYFAYSSASLIAGEVENGSIELTLMNPVRRRRIVFEKFLSTVPDAVVVSLLTLVTVVVSVEAIGESVELTNLVLLHSVGAVYLMGCASFGVLVSCVVDGEQRAQVLGFGGIAGMYIVEAVTRDTDSDAVGLFTLPRYFDPNSILIEGEVDGGETVVLVVATVIFVWAASLIFERVDTG
ncbi:MAG: ABC-2 type transport system permease protein [Methanobacteriota archaeon]|jgi:ABC-2 type transport system permease protein|uniref:ABC transporter permease subunit n=1 Tax=Halorutilus salinus TaxID=2487751 RepID=A0A9Q4C3Z2_9EURY|nr:ABC transporter permease subunit [Halorutilus salinus]MCX2818657.1 ABC transporter permease subunit [Halorutilus salinus]